MKDLLKKLLFFLSAPGPDLGGPEPAAKKAVDPQAEREHRIFLIHRNGNLFAGIGSVCGVVAVVALIIGLVLLKSGESGEGAFSTCGWSTLIAVGFYIAAQITHIRANTEK